MNNLIKNAKWHSLVILAVLLMIPACYEFDFINQPGSAQPDSSFVVQISTTTTGGNGLPYVPYFGILLPIGWTVNDSIGYTCDTIAGLFVYSDSLSWEMYNIDPAPWGYYWWVSAGVESVVYMEGDTYLFNPVIHTDNQIGSFYLDYMLGHNFELNHTRSDDHIITVGLPLYITVTSSSNSGPGSLRAAIDSIDFNGTITFDLQDTDTIFLSEQLNVQKNISITGPYDSPQVISGSHQSSIFYIHENSSPQLSNLVITQGSGNEGGGIYCNSSDLVMENISITSNSSAGNGGGISCAGNSNLVLSNSSIRDNLAIGSGGGIYCTGNSNLDFSNVSITGNSTGESGGGMYCLNSIPDCIDLALTNNSALNGGGLYCAHSNPSLINTVISGNQVVDGGGGGIYITDSSTLTVQNTVIIGNQANRGGAIYSHNSNHYFQEVTFSGNSAEELGGGIYHFNSGTTLINTIMWGDMPDEIDLLSINNSVTISWSDIQGGKDSIHNNNNGQVFWLEGSINEDPMFVGAGNHPYALSGGSPCIDSGTWDTTWLNLPQWDIIGNVRLWDGDGDGLAIVDMGAYEYGSVPVGIDRPAEAERQGEVRCYPNPFRSVTTLEYELKENTKVNLTVFNYYGQQIEVLVNESQLKGTHKVHWNGENLPSGIYYCRLQVDNQVRTNKIIKMQ